MKTKLCSLLLLFALLGTAWTDLRAADIKPAALTVESMTNPVGVDTARPRFSWKPAAAQDARALSQSAYRILASSSEAACAEDRGDLWDSGKVESDASLFIPYAGKELLTSQRVFWKVKLWDQNGRESDWSDPVRFVCGVMKPGDWEAKWIGRAETSAEEKAKLINGAGWIASDDQNAKTIFYRKEFTLDVPQSAFDQKELTAAFRYAGNRSFELYVNGKRVGFSIGMVFNPDILRSIDVTDALVPGKNVVAAKVDNNADAPTALLVNLDVQKIVPAEGSAKGRGVPGETVLSVPSDASWQVSPSASDGWNGVGYAADGWKNAVRLFDADGGPWGVLRRFADQESPVLGKEFSIPPDKKIAEATLHITGLGFYEAFLDGKKIGDRLLDPAPTNYDKAVLYASYDVTESLAESGAHSLDVQLGHGWYDVRSIVTWNFDAAPWRAEPKMIAQLELVYDDGSREKILSDESWRTLESPILFDCIRQGEIVDGGFYDRKEARREPLGPAVLMTPPKGTLRASIFPGAKVVSEFAAKSVTEVSDGVWVVDLGQNIAGWCRVRFNELKSGDVVRLRYSERILADGKIERHDLDMHFMEGTPAWYAGCKGGFQTDFYIARGKNGETFEPRFTYNGFQYVEVTGLQCAPKPEDFTARVVSNGFERIGSFESSDELLNKIEAATLSSYRANFVDGYPTDCPHREKNGWTGDAHLAAEQAMYNFENTACYEKWIRDLCDEQLADGNLAAIVPTGGWGYAWGNGPAWDSSLVLIPWYLYIYRGDLGVLEKSYDAMKRYVDYMTSRADKNFLISHGLGDWVFSKTNTPVVVTSVGYWYVDTRVVAAAARLLNKKEDAEKYGALAEKIRAAYNEHVLAENGVYSIGSQTSQSCAIHQGFSAVLSDAEQKAAFDKLVEQVEANDFHFDVGILGAKYILRTLSDRGRTDLALRLALQESRPSYADWIRRGAGTLWEDWGEGSSRNHIMFGDITAWFYQYLAGIRLDETPLPAVADPRWLGGDASSAPTAFKRFVIAPCCRKSDLQIPEREPLKYVSASVDSPRGEIRSSWKWNDDFTELVLDATIPVGTTATVKLPLEPGMNAAVDADAAKRLPDQNGFALFAVPSGSYRFTVK